MSSRFTNWHQALRVSIFLGFILLVAACSEYRQARSAYEAGDYVKAFQIFKTLSEAGDNQAQYDLSLMYLQGIGTSKNTEQGWFWMNRAAEKGNIQAMLELGVRYQKSPHLADSEELAFLWFNRAAMAGSAAGQYNLAHLYEEGDQIPVDLIKAYVWMNLSYQSGNPVAQPEAKALKAKLNSTQLDSADILLDSLKKKLP